MVPTHALYTLCASPHPGLVSLLFMPYLYSLFLIRRILNLLVHNKTTLNSNLPLHFSPRCSVNDFLNLKGGRRFLQFMNNSGYNLIYCPPLFSLPCAHPVYVPLWPSFKFGLSAEKISGWVRSRALTIFHVGQGAAKGHAFILA